MNRESDEQRAVSQTLCGALQKEANCKCLVLSVLIYGCLAAVTWCRCANVTKVVINFDNYPLKRTEHVSPCDEGYIYIPVAFMGMLYLVYLVECYHSPIRIDLLHAESQDNVMTKLSQLKLAQPTIWWKAVSYHYVRRKRQITRYRNGDNYTTTQVYYERANTHAATSFYFYDYCGVKDISKELTMEANIPITKITLSKGFAFSNMRSATEFEEARSRFFAEQELRDDYMEMREGLDLGYNFNPTTVVGILGNPWFTNSYVYWCLSALLLSWPLRIIIEYNTQYADYQVTKLFGVNYDTPTSGETIHASSSQLSAPGSYMLAPSYSEALLMDPSPQPANCQQPGQSSEEDRSLVEPSDSDIVPSYSEALLYERAQQVSLDVVPDVDGNRAEGCDCFCHASLREEEIVDASRFSSCPASDGAAATSTASCADVQTDYPCQRCRNYENPGQLVDLSDQQTLHQGRLLSNCHHGSNFQHHLRRNSLETSVAQFSGLATDQRGPRALSHLTRDLSAPNFQTHCELVAAANTQFLRINGNSLENILEHEEPPTESGVVAPDARSKIHLGTTAISGSDRKIVGCGTIPKNKPQSLACGDPESTSGAGYRLTENPMLDEDPRSSGTEDPENDPSLATSKTYFCLKSILKQHRRRYTLVTAEELRKLASDDLLDDNPSVDKTSRASRETRRSHQLFNRDNCCWRNKETSCAQPLFSDHKIRRVTSSRSLIFPSPIEEACRTVPNDPFGGKAVHVMPPRSEKPPDYGEAMGLPKFSKLARSLTSVPHKSLPADPLQRVRSSGRSGRNGGRYHRRNLSIEPEYLLQTDGWNTNEGKPVTEVTVENEVHSVGSSMEGQPGSSCSNAPVQMRRILTRGQSLNDSRTPVIAERNRRKKILRTSLTDTTGSSTSSFCFLDDQPRDDPNLVTTKRFNVSMETSL